MRVCAGRSDFVTVVMGFCENRYPSSMFEEDGLS